MVIEAPMVVTLTVAVAALDPFRLADAGVTEQVVVAGAPLQASDTI